MLVIVASAVAVYFYYKTVQYEAVLSQQKTESALALIEAKKNLIAASTPSIPESVFRKISIKDVNAGDMLSGLTVKDVKYNMQPAGDGKAEYLSSAYVNFFGSMTVSGKITWNDMASQYCVKVDEKDAYKIPRFKEDGRDPWFCFLTVPKSSFPDAGDRAAENISLTFEISNYKVQLSEKESTDTATFMRVVR